MLPAEKRILLEKLSSTMKFLQVAEGETSKVTAQVVKPLLLLKKTLSYLDGIIVACGPDDEPIRQWLRSLQDPAPPTQ